MGKFLIVGLGNIGKEYANTRHNIGFDVVHAFATKHGGIFKEDKLAYVTQFKFKGKPVVCICPTTYMNLSGKAFKYWLDKEKIELENSLTILDDLALPIEKIRIRKTGTHAGHNGLRDIQAVMGTDAYPKLRFGIGDQYPKGRQADFVLGKWLKNEEPIILQKIDMCVSAIESFISSGIDLTMTNFNNLTTTP